GASLFPYTTLFRSHRLRHARGPGSSTPTCAQLKRKAVAVQRKLSVVACRLPVMMMIDVIPQEFFDGVPVPPAVTLDGELLGALEDAPAGAWLAQMLDGVDVTSLTSFELPTYLRTA